MDARDGPPWVAVPERLDRRLRLGPFASGRELVKFVTAAAIGAIVGIAVAPWAGLAIVAVGALVTLWRPGGEPLDERVGALARWALRQAFPEEAMTAPDPLAAGPGKSATVAVPDGRTAAVLRTGGVPLAFLPPADLARQFELYRDLLRSVDGALVLVATANPIYAAAVDPGAGAVPAPERSARDGYRELVRLIGRRRSVRRAYVALLQDARGPDGLRRLETATALVGERLQDLGVPVQRLRDRALAEAAWRIGWLARERPT